MALALRYICDRCRVHGKRPFPPDGWCKVVVGKCLYEACGIDCAEVVLKQANGKGRAFQWDAEHDELGRTWNEL